MSWWRGPQLDGVWNLAPAHAARNASKSSRPPTRAERLLLSDRNVAIMLTPHPLRTTLALTLQAAGFSGKRPLDWYPFTDRVADYV